MLKNFTCFLLFVFILQGITFAQTHDKYWVTFTDKNNSPFSVSSPSAYLSARAIARRNNQGILIKNEDLPVNPAYVIAVAATGATILTRSKWFNAVTIYTTSPAVLAQVNALPFVNGVHVVNKFRKAGGLDAPTPGKWEIMDLLNRKDEFFPAAANKRQVKNTLTYDYGQSFNQIHLMNGEVLHDLGYRGQNMIIAVLDGGFNDADTMQAFDSVYMNSQVLGARDFVQPGGNVYYNTINHGMNCFSTMAAFLPGQLIGTAPKAKYWLLRSEDAATENIIEEDNWVSAAEFADSSGADIISSSLGYTTFDDPTQNHTYADMNGHVAHSSIAATIAARKGMVVVVAAGNSGSSPWHYISSPADADSILAVGATDGSGTYVTFSSKGPSSDGRVKPDVSCQGQGTTVASNSGGVFTGSGTSFACPQVAGLVACLWSAWPNMKCMDIVQAVRQSASQYFSPDTLLGYGIPNFSLARLILSDVTIPNIDNGQEPNVFPNPFTGSFEISFFATDTQSMKIRVYDVTGNVVFTRDYLKSVSGGNLFLFNELDKMANGVYFLQLIAKQKTWVRKLVKE